MTARKPKPAPEQAGKADPEQVAREKGNRDWLDMLTGRIGKIAALVTAVGGLILLIISQVKEITKEGAWLASLFPRSSPAACLEVKSIDLPETLAYDKWDGKNVVIRGTNTCERTIGLYVAYPPRGATGEVRYVLRVPREEQPKCKGGAAVREPDCWDPQKPIARGDWTWQTYLPPLARLVDASAGEPEKLFVTMEVRNSDEPDSTLRTETRTIKVVN